MVHTRVTDWLGVNWIPDLLGEETKAKWAEVTSAGQGQACAKGTSFPISRFKVCLPCKAPAGKDLQLRKSNLSLLGRGQHELIGIEGVTGFLSRGPGVDLI